MGITNHARLLGYILVSFTAYLFFGYSIERDDFIWVITAFGILFILYFLFLKETKRPGKHLTWAIAAAILFRLGLLIAIPNLSDDFYRFIWDGNLWIHGINPFLHTPETLMQEGSVPFAAETLYKGLNSPQYYSVYPPVCQYVFGIGALLFGDQLLGNIVTIRIFILAAEIGTIWILKQLLEHFNLNPAYLLLYALNPLIIMELTGNLHFEGFMIFFLLAGYYLFLKKQLLWSIVFFALALNTKLIPLLLIPYLVFSLGWKRSLAFIPLLFLGSLLLYYPFLEGKFITHFFDSLGLYFQSFEFNASIYYLVRWLGFHLKGYNIIQTAGPYLAVASTVLIFVISWRFRDPKLKNLPVIYITVTAFFYLFSTTVHPWYLSSLLVFVPLAGLLFPVAWSVVIPLSYTAYMTTAYTENLWLVALEYLMVLIFLYIDFNRKRLSVTERLKPLFSTGNQTERKVTFK